MKPIENLRQVLDYFDPAIQSEIEMMLKFVRTDQNVYLNEPQTHPTKCLFLTASQLLMCMRQTVKCTDFSSRLGMLGNVTPLQCKYDMFLQPKEVAKDTVHVQGILREEENRSKLLGKQLAEVNEQLNKLHHENSKLTSQIGGYQDQLKLNSNVLHDNALKTKLHTCQEGVKTLEEALRRYMSENQCLKDQVRDNVMLNNKLQHEVNTLNIQNQNLNALVHERDTQIRGLATDNSIDRTRRLNYKFTVNRLIHLVTFCHNLPPKPTPRCVRWVASSCCQVILYLFQ
jgi:hypothetical protein